MKRLLLIISAILSLATLQAQYLNTDDMVTITFIANNQHYYLEASNNGILTQTFPTDNCLWRLEVTQNGQYAFQDMTTGKYLGWVFTDPSNSHMTLSANPSAFSFENVGSVENNYMYGYLYYSIYYEPWWNTIPMYIDGEWGGSGPFFMIHNWHNYVLYIEKWEQKGAGNPTGHFNPSKIEFSYIGDQAGNAETDDDSRNVEFMIEATTESYYQCVNRPEEALLRRSTGDVDGGQVHIKNIYWESTGNKNSDLDANKYTAPQSEIRTMMTLSDPTTQNDGKWQFTITPMGASPMELKDKFGTLDRWIDYADNVIVEYTYGNSTEPQKAEMRVVRKSYRRMDLPTLVFSINPATYTFGTAEEEPEVKVFDVHPTHQHGYVVLNVDSQAVVTHYDEGPEPIQLTDNNLTLTLSDTWSGELTVAHDGDYKIKVTTQAHSGNKRSAVLTGTLHPQEQGSTHVPVSFTIDLHQRGVDEGIELLPNSSAEYAEAPFQGRSEQQVHTAERTIYYLEGEPIELRLPESGYSGYMRWYDYETNGGPNYNYCHDKTSTQWITAPYANNRAFAAINTPASKESAENKGEFSYGLYALNTNSQTTSGATVTAAMGAILNESNPNTPAPILQGWSDNKYHVMACDVSAYTDYEIAMGQNGQIASITEPTLSYRQLFHMRPASEIADKLAGLGADQYLEEYHYIAPAGKQILLSTEFRHSKVRSHESELCYFYYDNSQQPRRIDNRNGSKLKWYVSDKDGSNKEEYDARYSAEMDYLIVRSETYNQSDPVTKVYTLVLPAGAADNTSELRIARFEVEFVDIEQYGPTNKTIITKQRITNEYEVRNLIDFNGEGEIATMADGSKHLNKHLDWDESTYGYVYPTGELATKFKRGADQGAFPFYGEYALVNEVKKDWAKAEQLGGKDKGFAIYVDGTMEPGLVASIDADAHICEGQTMYCSAWFCNPAPANWSGEGNPIFRCNVQGKIENETEWEDIETYFVGELLKSTGWQQVVFPIKSDKSYDKIRVSIYNFATTNQGNDFMVDDICLYVSRLPIAAYHGKLACRSGESETTYAAAVLRLDYSLLGKNSEGYIYYQVFNENNQVGVNLLTNEQTSAYYHDNTNHGNHDHNTERKYYGSIHIPNADYNPTNNAEGIPVKTSVTEFLNDLMESGKKNGKAYIQVENDSVTKYLLYVAHIIANTENEYDANQLLYVEHDYSMRMAHTPDELDIASCNMQTPLHATQRTLFKLTNSDGEVLNEEIVLESTDHCANNLYSLTSTVENRFALKPGQESQTYNAPIISDWLIGDSDLDRIFEDPNETPENKEKAFSDRYTYTAGQVTEAIMYDMRRFPTEEDPNPNYAVSRFEDLQINYFESKQNYDIVKHLYDNGWLQLHTPTITFYLGNATTASYWCFPIEGTAKVKVEGYEDSVIIKDCNEPRRIRITSTESNYLLNIAPIAEAAKTSMQKLQIPTIKVIEGSPSVTFPITEFENTNIGGVNTEVRNDTTFATLALDNINNLCFMDMGKGIELSEKPDQLEVGKEYTIRLTLLDGEYEYPGNNSIDNPCRVGYIFLNLQILPSTLVWSPSSTSFNGWGKDENWEGWVDSNSNDLIDEGELCKGFVPTQGVDVIIPKLDNPLLYPYIVPEHEHSHYPMTIGFQVHHCKNIYFAPGAHIYNQHLLKYEKAFVDMQITAGKWNMVAAPLQNMVSGDMFIPHIGTYDGGELITEPNPFEVLSFQGIRHADAAYAFWQQFYNKTVHNHYEDGGSISTASVEFVQTNSLSEPLAPAHGYNLYGLGLQTGETLTIRLPKPDTEYHYFTADGKESSVTTSVNRDNAHKLAFLAGHDDPNMEITLSNNESSHTFLFGNPTMAYIDMQAFLETNKEQLNGVFHRMINSVWLASTELTLAEDRYLAPMTSVLLETKDQVPSTTLDIVLSASHLTLNNHIYTIEESSSDPMPLPARARTSTETEKLTIYALTPKASARTILATNPIANDYYLQGEDALFLSSGIENNTSVKSPLNMYTVAEQVPMMADVRQGVSQVPLAFLVDSKTRTDYMQLAFYYTSNWSRTCYFCDSKTGQKIRIMDGLVITIEMPLNHEQRYFIEGPDPYQASDGVTTSTTHTSLTDTQAWAFAPDRNTVVVSSNDLIAAVDIYDITGRHITSARPSLLLHSLSLHTTGTTGVYVVDVLLRNKTRVQTKVIIP